MHEDYEFEKLSWEEARGRLLPVKPDLVEVIDRLNPDKAFYLYFASYRYGEQILDRGRFRVPLAQKPGSIDLAESVLPNEVKNDLDYGFMPVSIVLKGAVEQVVANVEPERALNLRMPGDILALWAALEENLSFSVHPVRSWSIFAGAKTLLMLPPVASSQGNRRLGDFLGKKILPPKHYFDQQKIFYQIANSDVSQNDWRSTLLIFPREVFYKAIQDESYLLSLYFYKYAWGYSGYLRNKSYLDSYITYVMRVKNLRLNPYLLDVVKQLIRICTGFVPGFVFASDDSVAPVRLIQKAYLDVFNLGNYAPLMMHLGYYNRVQHSSVYYSLRYNISEELSISSRQSVSYLDDLRQVKYALSKVLPDLISSKAGFSGTLLSNLTSTNFHYFHFENDDSYDILSTNQIPLRDSSLRLLLSRDRDLLFCDSANFLKGCISCSFSEAIEKGSFNGSD